MKTVFLSIFGLVCTVAIIRLCYGLQANTLQYQISYFLSNLPDIKEDFQVVLNSLDQLAESFQSFGDFFISLVNSDVDYSQYDPVTSFFGRIGEFFAKFFGLEGDGSLLDGIGKILLSFGMLIASVSQFFALFIADIVKFFGCIFELLFGPVVVPIN